jgi:hypothetical protein
MSIGRDQFWRYAKETILLAYGTETENDRRGFIDLARTWTQAALVERRSVVDRDTKTAA